jgi:methionyl-tRNA synthetase
LRYYLRVEADGRCKRSGFELRGFYQPGQLGFGGQAGEPAEPFGADAVQEAGWQVGDAGCRRRTLIKELSAAKEEIIQSYESLNYAAAIRKIAALADVCNKYVEEHQPWSTIKNDAEGTRTSLDGHLNAVRGTGDLSEARAA